MPRRDQPQRRDERHAGLRRYLLGERPVVPRPDFRGGLAKRLGADGLGFFDAVPLVFRKPGHDQAGVDRLALECFGNTLGRVLRQRRLDHRRALETQPLAIGDHAIDQ